MSSTVPKGGREFSVNGGDGCSTCRLAVHTVARDVVVCGDKSERPYSHGGEEMWRFDFCPHWESEVAIEGGT